MAVQNWALVELNRILDPWRLPDRHLQPGSHLNNGETHYKVRLADALSVLRFSELMKWLAEPTGTQGPENQSLYTIDTTGSHTTAEHVAEAVGKLAACPGLSPSIALIWLWATANEVWNCHPKTGLREKAAFFESLDVRSGLRHILLKGLYNLDKRAEALETLQARRGEWRERHLFRHLVSSWGPFYIQTPFVISLTSFRAMAWWAVIGIAAACHGQAQVRRREHAEIEYEPHPDSVLADTMNGTAVSTENFLRVVEDHWSNNELIDSHRPTLTVRLAPGFLPTSS
ncbi:hypothetical protein K461DRAFT_292525 [Myriangium duriaei CBS 260.36]|uniref:Uncharacterized protein n=1 Tax=Myriangium duriaei CBS 260.36 TaxID=1168546 RepID=A0A9P4J3G6_9PEZI|nr:hypothetical protein K461DRAFT_292525 [Myriangium duriaei CBS 260.36]